MGRASDEAGAARPDRPIGAPVGGWRPASLPPADLSLTGRTVRLRPLDADKDAGPLFERMRGHPWLFDYLFEPPPARATDLAAALRVWTEGPHHAFAILPSGAPDPAGYACLMNAVPAHGDIEIGNVNLGPALQGTTAATEAFFLMIDWAIDAGYRRVCWKCNALNAPSRRAAQRLGFSFEGVFRNHLIVKGRNRDTAWFALTDADWADLRPILADWVSPPNFTPDGIAKTSLSRRTRPLLVRLDPDAARPDRDGAVGS